MTTTATLPALTELQSKKQWVCWCLETNAKGDTTKVPYQPRNGYNASSTRPENWAPFALATKALANIKTQDDRSFTGIGFVFHLDYTGIDLDHCVNADGSIEPWAQEILNALNCYAEFSPSKTGIHIIARGLTPERVNPKGETDRPGRKVVLAGKNHPKAAIEMYCKGRFFTITGNHVPSTPATIEDRQEAIEALYSQIEALSKKPTTLQSQTKNFTPSNTLDDDIVIEKAMQASNGATFSSLWRGDSGTDASAADLALCNLLAFWCQKDAQQIDRLFRRSGLYRDEKWDRNARTGETYGEGTIARAIERCREVYTRSVPSLPSTRRENEETSLPQIIIGKQLRDMTKEALAALKDANQEHPKLFVQQRKIKRIERDETHKPVLVEVGESELRNALTDAADFYRLKEKSGEYVKVPISPPKEIAQSIIGLSAHKIPFPPIETIVQTPVLRPDGTILDAPGYDATTHLFYMPQHDLHIPAIPAHPTQEDARQAINYVAGFLQDFPWEGPADRANALGTALTTVTRQMFKHVPIALIDATKQGTGKGLFTEWINILATGRGASAISPQCNDEELDKRITAMLMAGETVITIDNVEGVLRSPVLAKVLTSTYHKGRILGESQMVDTPQRAIWLANGNNLQVGGDMPRRSYRMRMLTLISDPDARDGFHYPDLIPTTIQERGQLIAALLTIARAWFVAGCPPPTKKMRKLGTFSHWCETIGGMLAYAGIDGFLDNLAKLRKEADVDGNAWAAFLEMWLQILGTQKYKASQIIDAMGKHPEMAEVAPEALAILFSKEDKSLSRKVGRLLAKHNGTPYGEKNLRICKEEDSHLKVSVFCIAGYTPQNQDDLCSTAGYAGYKPPLPHAEKNDDVLREDRGSLDTSFPLSLPSKNDIEPEANQITHTPQTSEIEHKTKNADTQYPANVSAIGESSAETTEECHARWQREALEEAAAQEAKKHEQARRARR